MRSQWLQPRRGMGRILSGVARQYRATPLFHAWRSGTERPRRPALRSDRRYSAARPKRNAGSKDDRALRRRANRSGPVAARLDAVVTAWRSTSTLRIGNACSGHYGSAMGWRYPDRVGANSQRLGARRRGRAGSRRDTAPRAVAIDVGHRVARGPAPRNGTCFAKYPPGEKAIPPIPGAVPGVRTLRQRRGPLCGFWE